MNEITQIRKLSIWIFLIPLLAINFCLIISQNYNFLENTIFVVDQTCRSGFSIPFFDGSLSISRASRCFPQYLIFKPAMILTSILLFYYWKNNNSLINSFKFTNINYKFKIFGILSAVFLAIHSIFLGIKFDIQIYKLLRRVVLLLFIIFEIIAQGILVYHFFKIKKKLLKFINKKILILKIILVAILAIVAFLSLPLLISKGHTHFKHALEWNYFIGVILFYLFSRFFWMRTT
ncbi:hypothetical protein N9L69_01420 [Candidatus Pelagibacter bacterium]|jgi:hypothetical protein|nr:hypothetical protein [Candidatus Pelagibacter bacterium]|tara:strand:+ start:184 stop:885 length:702 start_codon:yes stop_codon:yes gene_type:complete